MFSDLSSVPMHVFLGSPGLPSTDIKGTTGLQAHRKHKVHCVSQASLHLVTLPPKCWGRQSGWRIQHTAFLNVIKSQAHGTMNH